ncbi:hypothetical protein WJX73_000647 [Symbiochloris irregularis]|uniref:Uncharacterized protein n=1 Tax=Symbiochloris irregularis TaxID=706552 RepID=A0AAW1NM30_9CHLO
MGTRIVLHIRRTLRAQPQERLSAILQGAVEPGEQLVSISTPERTWQAKELTDCVLVGQQPWDAQLTKDRAAADQHWREQSASVRQVSDRLAANREEEVTIWGTGFVRTVAAHALLYAYNEQASAPKSSVTLRGLVADSGLTARLDGSSNPRSVTLDTLVKWAHEVVFFPNPAAYYNGLAELQYLVNDARKLLQRYQSLQAQCGLESAVLELFLQSRQDRNSTGPNEEMQQPRLTDATPSTPK